MHSGTLTHTNRIGDVDVTHDVQLILIGAGIVRVGRGQEPATMVVVVHAQVGQVLFALLELRLEACVRGGT